MDINLKDVQKWYADKINKQVIELDSYDLFCAKVAYEYACEQLTIPAVVGRSEQFSLADMKEAYEAGENNAGSYTYPPFEEWFSKR